MSLNKNQRKRRKALLAKQEAKTITQIELDVLNSLNAKTQGPASSAHSGVESALRSNRLYNAGLRGQLPKNRIRNRLGVRGSNGLANKLSTLSLRSDGPRLSEGEYMQILTNPGAHARTSSGAAAFVASIHPWNPPADYIGWVDDSSGRLTNPSYRTNTDIIYDATLFSTPPTAPGLGDVLILIPPVPEIAFIYLFFDHSTSQWSKARVVREQTFTSNISGQGNGFPTMLADVGGSKHRIPSKGFTLHFDAPDIANSGTIYGGQLVPEMLQQVFSITAGSGTANPGATASGDAFTFTFPIDTQSLARIDPSMYESVAKRGLAMPLKMAMQGGAFPYEDAVDGDFEAFTLTSSGAVANFIRHSAWSIQLTPDTSSDATQTLVFEPNSQVEGPAGSSGATTNPYGIINQWTPGGSHPSMTNWGVVWVKGYQYFSSGSAAAILRIEEVCNPDILVYGATPISPYTHTSPIYDPVAVDSTIIMQQIMPSAFPETANGFLDFLKNTVSWAAGKGRGLIQSLVGLIPAVGPLAAEVAGGVLDTANGFLNSTSP